ncbi:MULTISPECIES: type II toxin-antitoxin system HipA family toxin [Achromobacter]|uniref:HipA N-terminal domain protein 3 n=1 Tax=Achromobacter xylosoxidans (strain A8) TaxID=762376 RepID=E3HYI4_ACHXA|nr:type II toxin-antitoxin system HipA family toxin [Achromobacter xylosoxidans]ADP20138.1 HipA N-terminal domain protein 3 [Achromobacter xylosoxidans A8]
MRLDVHVQGLRVAQLYREADEYVLQYEPGTPEHAFVSVTMPVRQAPWRWPRDLHPFFRQNLPEGHLLGVIRELFGPLLDGTDLSLLAVVGAAGIGRVAVTPEGVAPGVELNPLNIDELLTAEQSTAHFDYLVRQYARSAVSGVVPKFLAPEDEPGSGEDAGKATLRTARHIIKGSDKATEFLGFNEHFTLKVLERLNVVPVVRTQMSADGRILVVDRFDVDAEGRPAYGVEDACNLLGLPPHEKYSPSTERALNATRAYIPAAARRQQNLHFAWQLLSNYVVRNADCHAKNIAIYYSSLEDVRYTPIYDVVTTQAYPQFSSAPGLSVDGRKTWAPGKTLARFCTARLDISPRDYQDMVEQLCESAVEVGQEILAAAKNEPRWTWIATQMVHSWNDGMCSLRSARLDKRYRGLDAAIAEAGIAAADSQQAAPMAIGRSELIAAPTRKRS